MKNMTARYVFVLILLGMLALTAYFLLERGVKAQQGDAFVINLSGRQRMLSQRLALFSVRLVRSGSYIERRLLRKEMQEMLDTLDESHDILTRVKSDKEHQVRFSEQIKSIYFSAPMDLDRKIHKYEDEIRALIDAPDADLSAGNIHLRRIIAIAYKDLLYPLDAAVKQYEIESEAGIAALRALERLLLGIGLIVLFLSGLFIFRPMAYRIQKDMDEIAEKEESLRKSNEALRALFQASPLAVMHLSPEGHVRMWNPASERIFGWKEKEIIGLILPIVPQEKSGEFRILRERVLRGEILTGVEVERRRKDGSPLDICVSAAAMFDKDGKVTGIIGILEDITERKKIEEERKQAIESLKISEENLRILLQAIPDCVCQFSLTGKFISMNEAGCRINGILDAREIIGNFYTSNVIENVNELEKAFRQASRGETTSVQYKTITKAGHEVWWDSKLSAIRGPDGSIRSILRVSRDITERIKAQEEQKNIILGLRAIMSISDELLACPDTNSLLKKAVESVRERLGFERCAIFIETNGYFQGTYGTDRFGQTTDEHKHKFLKDAAWKEHAQAMRSGEAQWFVVDEPYLEWDGEKNVSLGGKGWIAVTPVRSAQKILGVFVNDTAFSRRALDPAKQEILAVFSSLLGDIMERKHIEDALAEEKDRLDIVTNNANCGLFLLDGECRIIYANKLAEDWFGRFEELKGKYCWQPFQMKNPEKECAGLIVARTGKTTLSDTFMALSGGEEKWFYVVATPVKDESGKILQITEVIIDITRRKKIEDELFRANQFSENLLKTIPFAMDIVGEGGDILYMNNVFETLVGTDAVGRKCFHVYKDDKEQCEYCPLKKEVEIGKTEYLETSGVLGGRTFRIAHTGMYYLGKKAVLEIFQDISKEREAEKALRQAISVKSEFISMVSHELRTPLTAIKEGIAIVLDESAGRINLEQKNFLDIADRNVQRLARLINNVLDYQKLDSGRMEFFIRENEINEIAKEAQEDMRIFAQSKGLEFNLRLAPKLPRITCDRDKIIQVLTNLINNAIKFTEKGSVTITTAKIDEAVRVSVGDTGAGIKREDIKRLFMDFSQVATGKERASGSTGLGLAISRKIIMQHGGQIWVESEFGKGSTFYFTLPVK